METLFLCSTPCNGFFLKDANGYTLGHFTTEALAQAWCTQNGYRMRKQ